MIELTCNNVIHEIDFFAPYWPPYRKKLSPPPLEKILDAPLVGRSCPYKEVH